MKSKHRTSGLAYIIISTLIQCSLIPISHELMYSIALLFHEPYVSNGGNGIDFYPLLLGFLVLYCSFLLFLITLAEELLGDSFVLRLIHFLWWAHIVWFTWGEFSYRPYEHLLVVISIGTTILTRPLLRRLLHKKSDSN